jgi:hypothetical protein
MLEQLYKAKTVNKVSRSKISKEILRKYRLDHPRLSISEIAKRWGISQPTLNRIYNNDTEVSLGVFLQVLSGSKNTKKIAEYIELTDPSVYEALNTCFAHSLEKLHYTIDPHTVDYLYGNFKHNKNYPPFISQYIALFADKENLEILIKASTRKGIPKSDIDENNFYDSLKIHSLMNAKILILDESNVYRTKEKKFRLPFHIVKKNIEDSLIFYRLEEAGKENNWISFQTESLNSESLIEYKELLRKQFVERAEFLENNNKNGEHYVVTSSYSSTINAIR